MYRRYSNKKGNGFFPAQALSLILTGSRKLLRKGKIMSINVRTTFSSHQMKLKMHFQAKFNFANKIVTTEFYLQLVFAKKLNIIANGIGDK